VLLITIGAISLSSLNATNTALRAVYMERVVVLGQLERASNLINKNQILVGEAIIGQLSAFTEDVAAVDRRVAEIRQSITEIDTLIKAYGATRLSEEEARLFEEFTRLRTEFGRNALLPSLAALTGRDFQQASELQAQMVETYPPVRAKIEQLLALQLEGARQQFEVSQSRYTTVRMLLITVVAIGVLLAALLGLYTLRAITRPLLEAVRIAESVAAGSLTQSIQASRSDEIGHLMKALKAMNESLIGIVRQVRSASDSIGNAAEEIAQGNQDLSSRTEQAAGNLEQTASSLEQLTATVRQTADSARQANQLAASAAQVAQKGGAVVGQVVHTMNDISTSSQRISDIISVIDGIAFQTNILALNAAVEAARAGEQGRGFAVVASEVRSLAGRSAQAAKEIKDLIGASVDKVQNGSRLVQEAGATMDEIVSSVQRVSDIIGEITAAAAEQSEGIGQVNVAVNQLDQMTQQNAALVEQSTAASESLREQAARLAEAIGTFRTGADSGPAAAQAGAAVQRARPPAPSAAARSGAGAMAPRLGQTAPAPARSTAPVRPTHAKPATAATLPKPRPHPDAAAEALPHRSSAKASSKSADKAEGEWESF